MKKLFFDHLRPYTTAVRHLGSNERVRVVRRRSKSLRCTPKKKKKKKGLV